MDGARQMEWLVLQPGRSKPAPHRFIPSSLAQQQLTLLHDAKKTGAQLLQEQQRIISRDDADALAQSVAQAPPATSTMGQTLLHYASAAGALECVRWLVAAHAELIDAKTRDGEQAVHSAGSAGTLECLAILAEAGADLAAQDAFGWTPLHAACSNGHTAVVRYLLPQVDPNVFSSSGVSPLMSAVSREHVATIDALLKHDGVDPRLKNSFGFSAYDIACAIPNLYITSKIVRAETLASNVPMVHRSQPYFVYESARLDPRANRPDARCLQRGDPPQFALSTSPMQPVRLNTLRIPLPSRHHQWATEWCVDSSDPSLGEGGWYYASEVTFGQRVRWNTRKPTIEHVNITRNSWLCRRVWVRVMVDVSPATTTDSDCTYDSGYDTDVSEAEEREGCHRHEVCNNSMEAGLYIERCGYSEQECEYSKGSSRLLDNYICNHQSDFYYSDDQLVCQEQQLLYSESRHLHWSNTDSPRCFGADSLSSSIGAWHSLGNHSLEESSDLLGSRVSSLRCLCDCVEPDHCFLQSGLSHRQCGSGTPMCRTLMQGAAIQLEDGLSQFSGEGARQCSGRNSHEYDTRGGLDSSTLSAAADSNGSALSNGGSGPTNSASASSAGEASSAPEDRPVWQPDSAAQTCPLCSREFTIFVRRHHCRRCGRVVCAACSRQTYPLHRSEILLAPWEQAESYLGLSQHELLHVRVCDTCFSLKCQDAAASAAHTDVSLPGPTRIVGARDDMMAECPVCGQNLVHLTASVAEAHVRACFDALATSPAASRPSKRYIVYQLPNDAPLVGAECSICFNDFEPGEMMARMVCLCNYHRDCIRDWLAAGGGGCPLHTSRG